MCTASCFSLRKFVMALIAAVVFTAPVAAAPPGTMMDYHQSHMGGGPGWMGYMMGEGYGPGGGWGRGYGMGMGCGYGPGGGYMGEGYMGEGYMGGRSPMMGYLYGLNLSKDQRQKIRDLRQKRREENLRLMTQLEDESDKLDDLYSQETPNPKDVGKVYESIFSLRRQMIENRVQERNSIYALLTNDQKQQLKKEEPYSGRRGMMMW